MASTRTLVPLIYRADWTQWSVSAEVHSRRSQPFGRPYWARTSYRLLIAPGGRYRVEPISMPGHPRKPEDEQPSLIVCDGRNCWVVRGQEGDAGPADASRTPMDDVIRPRWLLPRVRLSTPDLADFGGRAAYHARGEPRQPRGTGANDRWSRSAVDLHIDAELGMLLRLESWREGLRAEAIELRDVTIDPAAGRDPASFQPPAEIEIDEESSVQPYFGHFGFGPQERSFRRPNDSKPPRAGDLAVAMAVGAVRMAARRPLSTEPRDMVDDEPEMPPADPEPDQRAPVSDEVVNLIAQAGAAPVSVTADVHRWVDGDVARHGPPPFPGAGALPGFYGPSAIWSQLRAPHSLARLQVVMPGRRYRIDYLVDERSSLPLAIACNGDEVRRQYHDRVTVGPAEPLPPEFAYLLDPAWLLSSCRLSLGGRAVSSARPVFRVIAEPEPDQQRDEADSSLVISALLDAELGFIHRLTSCVNGAPAVQVELRNVLIAPEDGVRDFSVDAGPGVPVTSMVAASTHNLGLPGPVVTASEAVASVINGAQAAAGWLAAQIGRVRDNQDEY